KPLGHVLDLAEERAGDVNGALLGTGDRKTVTRTRIKLDKLGAEFILLLQDQARKICGIFQLGNDRAFYGNIKALEDIVQKVVGQRSFLGSFPQEHADDGAHVVFDLNDEDFFVVTDEDGAAAVCGEYSANLD